MAGVFKVEITGTDELIEKLRGFKKTKMKAAVRKALRAGAKVTQSKAKQILPSKTGLLRRSLKVRAMKRSRKKLGVLVTTGSNNNLFSGKAFYGGFQEFGWKTGKRKRPNSGAVPVGIDKFVTRIGGKLRRKQIKGGNYLQKSAKQSEVPASAAVKATMSKELDKLLAKGK